MSVSTPPPPLGERWKVWGEALNKWLTQTRDKLSNYTSGDSAYQDGVLMWRRSDDKVIVSYDGAWHPLNEGGGTNKVVMECFTTQLTKLLVQSIRLMVSLGIAQPTAITYL